ncbi:CBS domain-containing protein [Sphaerisporangium aureirubrum]|uniref:HPP family protein n=1 Tax=Sphaerisporangium aureirubrum TaxID=1544736 RepID=A0ABW1NLC4_9ACTN
MITYTAAEVMSGVVVTVTPDESPLMAWELMRRAGVHHIPVVDEERRLHGILAVHDLAMGWPGTLAGLAEREVRDFLKASRLPRVLREKPLDEVAAVMLDADRDAVPVVDDHGHTVGIITTSDILKAVAGRILPARTNGEIHTAMFHLHPVLPTPA